MEVSMLTPKASLGAYSILPYNIILPMKSEKKPAKQQETQKRKEHPLKLFEGKRVVIKDVGPTTIEGDCIVAEPGYLLITNAKIIGTKHIAEAQLLYIPHHRIGFVHTEPTKVEKIEEP
jgi:hypothetical protein